LILVDLDEAGIIDGREGSLPADALLAGASACDPWSGVELFAA
jgi:hypothetical protein